MKQTVYLDVLILLNFAVDYFLLLGVGRLNRLKPRLRRLLLGSLWAAFCSLTLFLPGENPVLTTLYQALTAATTVLVTFGFGGLRRYLRLCAAFFGVSFGYAGLMFALWLAFRPAGMVIQNGVVYFDLSPLLLVLSSLSAYLVFSLLQRLIRRKETDQHTVQLEIHLQGRQALMPALVDTGHSLRDGLSDAPVVVAEYTQLTALLPENCRSLYQSGDWERVPGEFEHRFRMVPFATVGGSGMLPAFRADQVTVQDQRGRRPVPGCVVAVSRVPLGEEIHALVGPQILE